MRDTYKKANARCCLYALIDYDIHLNAIIRQIARLSRLIPERRHQSPISLYKREAAYTVRYA